MALPPFHGRMEVATVNGVTGLVEVAPGSVPLPPDPAPPGPGLIVAGSLGPKPPGT